ALDQRGRGGARGLKRRLERLGRTARRVEVRDQRVPHVVELLLVRSERQGRRRRRLLTFLRLRGRRHRAETREAFECDVHVLGGEDLALVPLLLTGAAQRGTQDVAGRLPATDALDPAPDAIPERARRGLLARARLLALGHRQRRVVERLLEQQA